MKSWTKSECDPGMLASMEIQNEAFLVGGFNQPLWKMMEWKSVGMMTFPIYWKNVPNHQPDTFLILTFVGSTNLAICCVFSVWFAITQPMAESIITSALTKHFFLPATNVGFQHPSGQASSQKNHGAAWWFEGIPIPVQNDWVSSSVGMIRHFQWIWENKKME